MRGFLHCIGALAIGFGLGSGIIAEAQSGPPQPVAFSQLVAAVRAAAVNSQSGNYTLRTSDCNVTVVETGSLQTIIVPSASGFPANCVIGVKNNNASRGQIITGAGLPADLSSNHYNFCGGSGANCLWPLAAFIIKNIGGTWITLSAPPRYAFPVNGGNLIIYADSVNGSDGNDCLASGKSACKTLAQAYNIACFTSLATQISFTGDMHNFLSGGCGTPRLIAITGTGSATVDDNGATGNAFECDDACELQISNFTINTTGPGSTGLIAYRGGIVDATSITFTTSSGNTSSIVESLDHANVSFVSGDAFSGGGSILSFVNAIRGGSIRVIGTTTISGTWTVSNSGGGCMASMGGVVDGASNFTGGTVSGPHYLTATAGGVNGAASDCPGSTSGSTGTSPNNGYAN